MSHATRAVRPSLTQRALSQPNEHALKGPERNAFGYGVKAVHPVMKGQPVVLGPQAQVKDSAWFSVRVERAQPDDFAIWHASTDTMFTDLQMPIYPQGVGKLLTDDGILLPNGDTLLDPDDPRAPPLFWRVPGGPPPPSDCPKWCALRVTHRHCPAPDPAR